MSQAIRIAPGSPVRLADHDPDSTAGFGSDKQVGRERLEPLNKEIEKLQEALHAEHRHKLLVVLQGMDTSGKDGAIRKVFEGVNPQGVRVATFKAPTPEELDHDYLWRIHRHVPGRGQIVIFNRSHYEDVLIVRVQKLVPEATWRKRYEQISAFEQLLAEEGTTILKFFLHIDKAEQKRRLQARLDDPEKHWKFNAGDLKERALWDGYTAAYEEAISRTSTEHAPWFIVPANRKWVRDLVIAQALVDSLQAMKIKLPRASFDPAAIQIED